MNSNLYALFAARFPKDKQACAIEVPESKATGAARYYTWDDIERATAKIANLLAKIDLPKGSRVAVQVEKSPEALLLYLATVRAGLVYLPLNTAYRESEMAYFLGDAEPGVVVCDRRNFSWLSRLAFKSGARHVFTLNDDATGSLLERAGHCSDQFALAQSAPDDLAAILYTSGTTGRSKGAMLSHGNLASNVQVLKDYWRFTSKDVLLHALPLFHIHGLFVACHCALISGCKTIFLNRFDTAEILQKLPRSTVFMGVPTFYTRLLSDPGFDAETCRNMRLFISGSAPLLTETFNSFIARTGHTILERYGMSETAMLTSNPYEGLRIGGTVGMPLPGVSVRVVSDTDAYCAPDEIGNIQVKGPNVFSGYWRMPEKTREEFTDDGWFKTGDVGKFGAADSDAKGYLSIVGRSKDLIISGGYNVYPKEIETVIDGMEGVLESAVIGVPHADFGEGVVAVVVSKSGCKLDETTMIAALKSRIANFKVPKLIHVVDELPRNAMGKVQKNRLRELYSIK